MSEVWLSRKEAARYITKLGRKISPQTLANMASNKNKGNGPPFSRRGWNQVNYLQSDLDAWVAATTIRVGVIPIITAQYQGTP